MYLSVDANILERSRKVLRLAINGGVASTTETRWLVRIVAMLCVGVASLMTYKVVARGYALSDLLPLTRYHVALTMSLDGHRQDARVRTFLPVTDARQNVSGEENLSQGLHFQSQLTGLSREASWSSERVPDGTQIRYAYDVVARPIRYELHPELEVPSSYPQALRPYLASEDAVQVESTEVQQTLAAIGADRGALVERLKRIYARTGKLKQRAFKGPTDALTALRLGEASCNGKSRLFVALARRAGIPARLVGGLIMQRGQSRTTHQWVEAYVAGHWVPFDPTNHHFAELPARYLTLYYGDESLFVHSKEVNFHYRFDIEDELVPSPRAKSTLGAFNVWALFERLHISFSLLRTLLMLPMGALLVVIFRNVIGMPTFGTFLPALIASATSETGALWGLVGLLIVLATVSLARLALHRLQLLHSPTLAILLTLVTAALLATSLIAEHFGLMQLTRITLFPIAVLAITAERFYLAIVDQGPVPAFKQLAGTLAVIAVCHVVMSSLALQILVIGFPEVLLLCVAMNMYLGRWVGMRLFEYRRFSKMFSTPSAGGQGA